MSRKVVRMTLDHLAELEAPCRDVRLLGARPGTPRARRRAGRGEGGLDVGASCATGARAAASCSSTTGRSATRSTRRRRTCPGAGAFPTAPVSADAVLLSAVYVEPDARGGGLGRMLVQGMARDLIERGGIEAVEAFGDTRGPGRPGARSCVDPVDFLTSVGFKTQRAHATTPRMRMDLRSALSWREELEAALERLLGAVRPAPKTHGRPPATTTRG